MDISKNRANFFCLAFLMIISLSFCFDRPALAKGPAISENYPPLTEKFVDRVVGTLEEVVPIVKKEVQIYSNKASGGYNALLESVNILNSLQSLRKKVEPILKRRGFDWDNFGLDFGRVFLTYAIQRPGEKLGALMSLINMDSSFLAVLDQKTNAQIERVKQGAKDLLARITEKDIETVKPFGMRLDKLFNMGG